MHVNQIFISSTLRRREHNKYILDESYFFTGIIQILGHKIVMYTSLFKKRDFSLNSYFLLKLSAFYINVFDLKRAIELGCKNSHYAY